MGVGLNTENISLDSDLEKEGRLQYMEVSLFEKNIPDEIKTKKQWVAWRGERRDNGKMTKKPCNPRTGRLAKTNDASTWSSFDEALSSCEKYGLQGVGFVFTPDDPYVGIDLDHCIDLENGALSAEASDILKMFNTYTEVSPSKEGLHLFVKGRLPGAGKKNAKIEIYDQGRFFTITGDKYEDAPAVIEDGQEALTALYHQHFPDAPEKKSGLLSVAGERSRATEALKSSPEPVSPEDDCEAKPPHCQPKNGFPVDSSDARHIEDDELIDKALTSKNGDDFKWLWQGDFSGYPSHSEADLALCRLLSFWTGYDAQRMDRLFRKSGLYRPKWDEEHYGNGSTYGEGTIKKAISSTKETYSPSEYAPATATSARKKHKSFPLTDLGNAERLAAQFGDDIRYCRALNRWLVWDGKRWVPDETGNIHRIAKKVVRSIYDEAREEEDDRRRRDIGTHATKSESAPRIKSMISLAKDEEGISVPKEDFDSNLWLLNCLNGTIDLRSGELLPHRRGDLITRLVPVEYDPNAKCPVWDDFLHKIMDGNQNVISFLQRAIGYSLTGDTSEQCLFFLWGTGANGKSTFLQAIKMMLNDYALQTPTETLLVKRQGAIPNDVARLAGARFITATEAEANQKLAEGLIKQMTGIDTICARFLNKEYFDFNPTHKIFLATNHKPVIQGTDHAIWRRIRLVNFNVTIPEAEMDKHLLPKLEEELPGILAWAVRGCLEWKKNGLGEPEEVKAATNSYREEMDVLSQFMKDCCRIDAIGKTTSKDLWDTYVRWCEDNNEEQITRNLFSRKLKDKGLEQVRTGTPLRRFFRGVELLTH